MARTDGGTTLTLILDMTSVDSATKLQVALLDYVKQARTRSKVEESVLTSLYLTVQAGVEDVREITVRKGR